MKTMIDYFTHLCRLTPCLALIAIHMAKTCQADVLPKGHTVLQNGALNASKTHAEHWITRDSTTVGTFTLIPPKKGELYGILQVDVKRASEQPWALELRQKVDSVLKKGETLYLTFEYHITPGYAFHVYWQQDSHPWPKYLSLRIAEPTERWGKCMVAVPVHQEMPTRSTSLSFHLGEQAGTVQFRNFVGIAVPASVDPRTLETNAEAVFGGDYYDKDWRERAHARLLKTRKTDLAIIVKKAGQTLSDIPVKVQQQTRDFSFGVDVPAALLADGALDGKAFADLRERLGTNIRHLPDFRVKVTNRKLFDTVTFPRAMIWRMHNAWGHLVVPQAIAVARSQGMKVRGHTLYCPAFHFAPPKCRQMDASQLTKYMNDFIREQASTYAGTIDQWDVLHGVLSYDEIYDYVGVDSLINAFRLARSNAPKAELLLSDDDALRSPADNHLQELLELVNWLRVEKSEVAGLALSAALEPPYIAPQAIDKRLDMISQKGGPPVYISGLEIAGAKPTVQAAMLKDLLLALYSHGAVQGISLGSVWGAALEDPRTALYRENMSPRAAAKVLEELLTKEWWTDVKLTTDKVGSCQVSAFHGTYHITATVDGNKIEKEVQVKPARLSQDSKPKDGEETPSGQTFMIELP